MAPIIRMQNLTKKFGNVAAVDHLDLDVEEGEILGLLGPNGAGKTTVILMLATVIKPTEGTATVGNYDIRKQPDKVRGLIGIGFQEPKMLWVATPWDVVNWHAKVCGLSTRQKTESKRRPQRGGDVGCKAQRRSQPVRRHAQTC